MRRPRTPILVALASLLLASPPPATATASAVATPHSPEVEWRNDAVLLGDYQRLVVDPGSGDLLAMTSGPSNQVVRRLDGRTGAVEWTAPIEGMSHLLLDPSTGRVVLGGYWSGGVRVIRLDPADGTVVVDTKQTWVPRLTDLAVDPVTGQTCVLGRQRRSETPRAWVTSCLTADGTVVFSRAWYPPEGQAYPKALSIDPRSHRVYVAGTSRTPLRHEGRDQDVVLLAYDAGGDLLWRARSRGAVLPSSLEMAIDPERGRVYLLGEAWVIRAPVRLFSFDSEGRKRFRRGWRVRDDTVTATALEVTRTGVVLAVSAGGRRAGSRSYAPSGRLLSSRLVPIADRGGDGGLPQVVIDPRRRRAHVVHHEGWPKDTSQVFSFGFEDRYFSRTVVDRRRDVMESGIAVDPARGRVFAATVRWRGPDPYVEENRQRITAIRY